MKGQKIIKLVWREKYLRPLAFFTGSWRFCQLLVRFFSCVKPWVCQQQQFARERLLSLVLKTKLISFSVSSPISRKKRLEWLMDKWFLFYFLPIHSQTMSWFKMASKNLSCLKWTCSKRNWFLLFFPPNNVNEKSQLDIFFFF